MRTNLSVCAPFGMRLALSGGLRPGGRWGGKRPRQGPARPVARRQRTRGGIDPPALTGSSDDMVSCWRSTSPKAVAWWRAMTRSWRNGWRQRGQRLHREPQRLYRQVFYNLSPLNCGAVRGYQRLGPRLVGISPHSLPTDTALVGRFGDARVNFFPKKCLM